jgi:hypothetical protein
MPKAIRFNQVGGPEVLHIEDLPEREPGPGELQLKVEAVGLNRAESMYYHGLYMEKVNLPSGLDRPSCESRIMTRYQPTTKRGVFYGSQPRLTFRAQVRSGKKRQRPASSTGLGIRYLSICRGDHRS